MKKEGGQAQKDDVEKRIQEFLHEKLTYFYEDAEGTAMVEVHVDTIYAYDETDKDLPPLGEFGGNTSVRLEEGVKPRLYFGQDEAIYRSSQLNDCCWVIDGVQILRSKGLGVGVMASALVSRAFGFGYELNDQQLSEINKTREGKKYADEEASIYLYGSASKKPLVESPFVRYLDYGSGKDGYWTYRHMVLQI